MPGVFRTGYQAVASAVWSLVAVASRTVNVTHYNGTALSGNLNASIAKTSGLISQINDAFIAAGGPTGSSTLGTTIDITKPYWITILGVTSSSNAFTGIPRLTSFNGSVLAFTRPSTTTVDDLTVSYLVVGTP
jgi:hypothetical protein